ncbi:MAG: hypothetical protein ABI700_25445, partial [Chloroflexota bacterium]
SGGSLNAQQIMNQALEALRSVMRSPRERVKLIRTTPLPFGGFDLESPAPQGNSKTTETAEYSTKI